MQNSCLAINNCLKKIKLWITQTIILCIKLLNMKLLIVVKTQINSNDSYDDRHGN